MAFYDPPQKKYNVCHDCGITKPWDYYKYCVECQDGMDTDQEFWGEVQAWLDAGCPEFAHVPGTLGIKVSKVHPWTDEDPGPVSYG